MRIKSKTAFLISLVSILLGPILAPKLHLFYFVPYLVVALYQHSKIGVLWRAFFCGILLDLLSSTPFFGFSSLTYCVVSWLLYGQTRNFFEDKLSTLPLMSYLFAFLSTLLSLIFNICFNGVDTPSFRWVLTDLCGMPLADALFALLVFSLPFELIYSLRKVRLFEKQ